MFALPGILALIIFILGRPFDLVPSLQGLPLLYFFCGAALFGFLLDLRVGFLELRPGRQLLLVAAFIGWCILTVAVRVPGETMAATIELLVVATVYFLVAHGIQTFKGFHAVALTVLLCAVYICVVCLHQSQQPLQCIAYPPGDTPLTSMGVPTGQVCDSNAACPPDDGATQFSCEHVGWFDISSVNQRVRYVGTLQDPNEVALFSSAALPFAFAFYQLRPTFRRRLMVLGIAGLVLATVLVTHSRGGLLTLLAVFAVYAVQRYGLWRVLKYAGPPAVALVLFLLVRDIATTHRADAADSTAERLGCMHAGVRMAMAWPIFGAGYGQFTQHHHLVAHNAYVHAAGELGYIGMVLWVAAVYLTLKSLLAARRQSAAAEAVVGRVWGLALTTSLSGVAFGILFLSMTYHFVLWTFLGLAAAYSGCVATHRRRWRVRLDGFDFAFVTGGSLFLLVAIYVYTTVRLS